MATMIIPISAPTFSAVPKGYTFTGTLKLPQLVSAPIRINSANLYWGYARLYVRGDYLTVTAGDTAFSSDIFSIDVDSNLKERDVALHCSNPGADHLLKVQSRTVTFTVTTAVSTSGNIIDRPRAGDMTLTLNYDITTTACTAPTALTASATLTEGNVTLTGAGAEGGAANGIAGYELQYRDSADSTSWGGWNGYTTVGATGGSFSASVPPPARGYYRQWRARTVGTAGSGWESPWKEATNTTRRYALSILGLNKTSLDAGGAITASIGPMAANLTHRVKWLFGNRSEAKDIGASVFTSNYTIPTEWLDQIPTTVSGVASCVLETILNGTVLGSVSIGFTITCPASVVPSIGTLTAAPVSDKVPGGWGLYLKGQSKARITMGTVAAGTGSTIVSRSIVGGGYSGSGTELLTGLVQAHGNVEFTANVTDGRGRTATKTIRVFFDDYNTPKIVNLEAYRANAQGIQTDNSTQIGGTVNYSFTKVGENDASIWVYVNDTPVVTAESLSRTSNAYALALPGPYDTAKSFKVRIVIKDTVGAVDATAETLVNTASRIMSVGTGVNAGVAFGKMCEYDKTVELTADWNFRLKGKAFIDLVYPVGAIYMSAAATNPGTLFGGTWAAWGAGRVPIGVGSNGTTNYTGAEATGGAESHSHAVNSHSHTINDHSHYVGGHTHTTGDCTLNINQIPSHNHRLRAWAYQTNGNATTYYGANAQVNVDNWDPDGTHITYSGGSGAHNHGSTGATAFNTNGCGALTSNGTAPGTNAGDNRQPYITCYMWKRTA